MSDESAEPLPAWRFLCRAAIAFALTSLLVYMLAIASVDAITDAIYANVNSDNVREMPTATVAIAPASDGQLVLGGRGEGLSCSIPRLLAPAFDFQPVAIQFRQACIAHDFCYRHGAATYGYTQLDCDRHLQEDAFRLCKFVYTEDRQSFCQTQARKVLLGVRLGGAGSFRPAASQLSCGSGPDCGYPDPARVSTYFEYELVPHPRTDYVVARLAPVPAPAESSLLRTGLYYFVIRASGVSVRVYGVRPDGAVVALHAREIRGSTRHLMAPPQVVGDAFFWWRRASRNTTGGSARMLDPLTATEAEWADVLHQTLEQCESGACDPEASTLFPLRAASALGTLVGLTTHSCQQSGGQKSELCLVALTPPAAPMRMWPVRSSYFDSLRHKDRYRSLALSPWLAGDADRGEALYFTRRDETADRSPAADMTLFRVALSPPTDAVSIEPRITVFREWREDDEPFILRGGEMAELLSFRRYSSGVAAMEVRRHRGERDLRIGRCADLGGDWLDIPPVFFGSERDTVVFRRLSTPRSGKDGAEFPRMQLTRVKLTPHGCEVRAHGEVVISGSTLEAYLGDPRKMDKASILKRLVGQSIVSDIDGNGALDFILTQPEQGARTLVRMNLL